MSEDAKLTITLVLMAAVVLISMISTLGMIASFQDVREEQKTIIKILEDPEYYEAYKKWQEVNNEN